MKRYCVIFLYLSLLLFLGCNKNDDFSTDPSHKLEFSTDSILFDTLFTATGSVTQRVKIFNRGTKALRIQEIKLGGGNSSNYKININGIASHLLNGVEIGGKDSISLFVKVTIDPNSSQLPFLVKDSISLITNGNLQKIILTAFGQNANFIKSGNINDNTIWDSKIPYVVYNMLKIKAEKTLTIKKVSRIYFHKDAEMVIDGTLKVEGSLTDSVVFSSDRPEKIYEDEPGQWMGLTFTSSSKNNVLNYAVIKNGSIGIKAEELSVSNIPKIVLANTIIKNMEVASVYSSNSHIEAFNCTVINAGKYLVYAINGGKYNFKQNTFSNFSSKPRNTPSLLFSDGLSSSNTRELNLELVNNIIWGNLQDEIMLTKKGSGVFNTIVKNNLIKTKGTNFDVSNIFNVDPLFKNERKYNFQLNPGSPAANKGTNLTQDPAFNIWLNKDLRGKERLFPSDLGSYEIL